MSKQEHPRAPRDSLFLLASLRIEDQEDVHTVKIRNLSATGMMVEGAVPVDVGFRLSVNVRNIGWVQGSVAWVRDNRFGMKFHSEINPGKARFKV